MPPCLTTASQLLRTVNLLRAVLISVANCAGGPPK